MSRMAVILVGLLTTLVVPLAVSAQPLVTPEDDRLALSWFQKWLKPSS